MRAGNVSGRRKCLCGELIAEPKSRNGELIGHMRKIHNENGGEFIKRIRHEICVFIHSQLPVSIDQATDDLEVFYVQMETIH